MIYYRFDKTKHAFVAMCITGGMTGLALLIGIISRSFYQSWAVIPLACTIPLGIYTLVYLINWLSCRRKDKKHAVAKGYVYMKYDDYYWYYGGDYPDDLPQENAATHIGMFLAWCICNNLVSDELREDCGEDIENVVLGNVSGAQFLIKNCDGIFCDSDLTETGQKFAADYYNCDSEFSKEYCDYFNDYCKAFDNNECIYYIEDSKENYFAISSVIDKRFVEWNNKISNKEAQ